MEGGFLSEKIIQRVLKGAGTCIMTTKMCLKSKCSHGWKECKLRKEYEKS